MELIVVSRLLYLVVIMIHVALVDDHVIVRSGFAQLLNLESDITVVGEFGSVAEARKGLPAVHPHVVILDISMPDESGLNFLAKYQLALPA